MEHYRTRFHAMPELRSQPLLNRLHSWGCPLGIVVCSNSPARSTPRRSLLAVALAVALTVAVSRAGAAGCPAPGRRPVAWWDSACTGALPAEPAAAMPALVNASHTAEASHADCISQLAESHPLPMHTSSHTSPSTYAAAPKSFSAYLQTAGLLRVRSAWHVN